MQAYYRNWAFKHPKPEDFKHILDSVTGENQDVWFDQRLHTGITDTFERHSWRLRFLFDLNQSYANRTIHWMPFFGYNAYDRLMPGFLIHNHGLPPSRVQAYAMPLFSLQNKALRGLAGLDYTRYGRNWGEKWIWKIKAAHFSMDEWNVKEQPRVSFSYKSLHPSLTYHFGKWDPRSSIEHAIQFDAFFFSEESPVYTTDTTTNSVNISKSSKIRMTHQLSYRIMNNRTLYPYSLQLMAEWSDPYMRFTALGNYHYQYADGGGLKLRGFLGGFLYNRQVNVRERFESERFQLNLSGINGYEDYTYSHYFMGRNRFDGWMHQQMAIRDGGFRIRTDLLNQKIGKSDQWLMAFNATSTIPQSINPFRNWNVKNPLRLFLDVGTNASIWNNENGSAKILYNAGIQLSLFKEVLNLYLPLAYSEPFRNYVKTVLPQPSWKHRLSFSIDLSKINRQSLAPGFPLQ
jgi:hypothetical protein